MCVLCGRVDRHMSYMYATGTRTCAEQMVALRAMPANVTVKSKCACTCCSRGRASAAGNTPSARGAIHPSFQELVCNRSLATAGDAPVEIRLVLVPGVYL